MGFIIICSLLWLIYSYALLLFTSKMSYCCFRPYPVLEEQWRVIVALMVRATKWRASSYNGCIFNLKYLCILKSRFLVKRCAFGCFWLSTISGIDNRGV